MSGKKVQQLIYYAKQGFPIFPVYWIEGDNCACGNPGCKSPGKHPIVKNGFYDATTDQKIIKSWHEKWPLANWAMRTGSKEHGGAGVIVIDIDLKSGGFESWDLLLQENPGTWIETVMGETGGGGLHIWLKYPDQIDIPSAANVLGPGIDIRGNNGYVLVPPSITQEPYKYKIAPGEVELQEIPSWMLPLLERNQKMKKQASERFGDYVPQGQRHGSLVSLAGSMRRVGMEQEEIKVALLAVRDNRFAEGDHPVTENEVVEVAKWVSSKQKEYMQTDLGNAERFVEQNAQNIRFCHQRDSWLTWDSKRWAPDDTAESKLMAFDTVRSIYADAASKADEIKRKQLAKHAIRSEARSRIENMIYLSQALLSVRVDELDQHPMLLNVANGTVDLETGNLLPHNRDNMLTKLIDVEYNPDADCPEWKKCLDIVTGGNNELAYYIQKAIGYSLSGSIDELCLFFLYGTGQNGKTTIMETMQHLLGDYALRSDIEALMQTWGRGQAANPHVANMAGARFVLASEIPENRKINESLLKDLTGGDTMTARYLHSNPFTFNPIHKLWLYGNHKPKVSGTDWGFWRRMRVIPFSVTIPDDVRRPMSEVIQRFDEEMSGILTWAVIGCLLWQSNGLEQPKAVVDATSEYRTEQDMVQQFIDENCEMHPDYKVEKSNLYSAWRDWCDDAGEEQAKRRSKAWVTRQMTKRGFENGGMGRKSLIGVRLKND